MTHPIDPARLRDWATTILEAVGLPQEPAASTAEALVEGDLYGHTTHGLALLPGYVEEVEAGNMAREGRPEVVSDAGAIALWDARRLAGLWTTRLAIDDATRRAETLGMGAIVLRRSHHIGCLAAFLEGPARRGHLVLILSSDPADRHVAPYGGTRPVMTPDPIAAGIPRRPDPVLVDVSTSITAAGWVGSMSRTGERMPGEWLMDAAGTPTDDPGALAAGGSILPIGGRDHGYKGYGLALMVEALTQGLGGYGRAEGPTEWGASVLVLVFAPERIGGSESFLRETEWLADACLATPPIDPARPVRLPGQLALERKRAALASGLVLPAIVHDDLSRLAERIGPPLPA